MRAPKVLIGCARSKVMANAFRHEGAIVAECDTEESREPGWHIKGDVREVVRWGIWDAALFHPPCTFLTNAGVRWLYVGGRRFNADGSENPIDLSRWAEMEAGAALFRDCLDAPIPFVAVENPVPHDHAMKLIGQDFDFSYQPHNHGEPEFKRTCWWLRRLPVVPPSDQLPNVPVPGTAEHKAWSKVHRAPRNAMRAEIRSETLPGVARALARAWVPFIREQINQRAAA